MFADLGSTVLHNLAATNGLAQPGTVNISVESSEGWSLTLLTEDGEPLEDTNDDGQPDLGEVGPSDSVQFTVEIVIPAAVRAGIENTSIVTASLAGSGVSATAELTTTVNSKLVLSIDMTSLASGDVVAGTTSAEGVENSDPTVSYVAPEAVVVTISSNGMWLGTCFGNASLASQEAPEDGAALNWRLAGADGEWIELSASPDDGCFPNSAPGIGSYVYDLELEVEGSVEVDSAQGSITFGARGAGD